MIFAPTPKKHNQVVEEIYNFYSGHPAVDYQVILSDGSVISGSIQKCPDDFDFEERKNMARAAAAKFVLRDHGVTMNEV